MTCNAARPLDILYVGPLPPLQGGTAMAAYPLLTAMAAQGHRLRAIATITPATRTHRAFTGTADQDIAVTWFEMPYFEDALAPAAANYRARQTRLVLDALSRLVDEQRPDVILVGRNHILQDIPDFAATRGIPVVIWQHVVYDIDKRQDDELFGGAKFAEMTKAACVVTCARHMTQPFIDAGFQRVAQVANGIDTRLFQPTRKDSELLAQLDIGGTQQVAIHASNLKSVKRPMDLVACADVLRERCPQLV